MKAIWNNVVLAESNKTIKIEGNQYFPPESVHKEYFTESHTHTHCPWKGEANYYTIKVNNKENEDAAWFYPQPKKAAMDIKDYVAFWKDVKIEK